MTYYTPQQAHDDITELFDAYYDAKKAGDTIPPNKRIESADAIVEHYVEVNGERPPKSILSRLATYILLDTLTDSHPDKMSREEYPIMTNSQRKRRVEIPSNNVYFDKQDYVGFRTVYEKDDENASGYVKKYPIYNVLSDEVAEEQDVGIDVLTLLDDAGLTERQREAIELVYFEGLTQEKAGERMGVNKSNVNEYIKHGFTKIRRSLSETS